MAVKIAYVAQIVLPIFLMVAIGYAVVRLGIIKREMSEALSKFTFYLALPLLIFLSIIKSDVEANVNWILILSANGYVIFFFILVFFFSFFLKLPPAQKGVVIQASYRSNMAYIGLPVCLNAFGQAGLARAVLFFALVMPIYNVLAVFALTLPQHRSFAVAELKKALGSIVKNPLIIASVLGFAWYLTGLALPKILDHTLSPISETALPLSLVSVGCAMHFASIGERVRSSLLAAFFKLFLYPLMAYFIFRAFGFPAQDYNIAIMLLATPTAVASYVMAREMDGDEVLAADVVMVTTILSVVSLPAWLLFLL